MMIEAKVMVVGVGLIKFRVELFDCVYEIEAETYGKARSMASTMYNEGRVAQNLEELPTSFLVAATKCSKVEKKPLGRKRKYDEVIEKILEVKGEQ